MKILIAGAWQWSWYEQAFFDGFKELGVSVDKFTWQERFCKYDGDRVDWMPTSTYKGLQNRFLFGPELFKINRDLVTQTRTFKPDVLFLYRPTHIFKRTLEAIKRETKRTLIVQYCNDDPFGPYRNPMLWRHLKESIRYYDINFVYRRANIRDFQSYGSTNTHLLRSYFIPGKDFKEPSDRIPASFVSDVVFAGHYENDGRVELFDQILGNGINFRLYGGGWDKSNMDRDNLIRNLFPIRPVINEEYRYAISGAKIALCLLSKINRDTYTRRNFEIPAMKTFMLSEYTEDLASLFVEGEEAEFFRDYAECIDKVNYYLRNDALRERIAQKGYESVFRNGHDIRSRAKEVLRIIAKQSSRL